jgi:glycopeptide antibiotics resistance protein
VKGGVAKDLGEGIPADLVVPGHVSPYRRTFLESSPKDWGGVRRNFKDILINVVGFIPLGFLLARYLRYKGCGSLAVVLLAVAAGFGISFFIEILQAFLPARSSDMMDLIANTFGTIIGCLGFVRIKNE